MNSGIMWLDFSERQQRHIRDVLRNYEDKGTVDDLGFGTIRDAISNGLFPGTSIIQTRARYFLFIPWIFIEAQRKWPKRLVEKASDMERKLIDALKTADDTDGLIGKEAGANLKTLPSSIYWAGLQQFGIFKLRGKTIRQFGRIATREVVRSEYEGEVVDQYNSFWSDLPKPPARFFTFASADMNLTREEAEWLTERIIATAHAFGGPSLLSQLVMQIRAGATSLLEEDNVWDLQEQNSLSDRTRELLFQAERFSLLANGLSLLYNEMLCERIRQSRDEFDPGEDYVASLAEWSGDATSIALLEWCRQLERFWDCLAEAGANVAPKTRRFLEEVARVLTREGLDDPLQSEELRALVRDRELTHKGSQARFGNLSRLNAYTGAAGTRRMDFRWNLVQRLLSDIAAGYETQGR